MKFQFTFNPFNLIQIICYFNFQKCIANSFKSESEWKEITKTTENEYSKIWVVKRHFHQNEWIDQKSKNLKMLKLQTDYDCYTESIQWNYKILFILFKLHHFTRRKIKYQMWQFMLLFIHFYIINFIWSNW